MLVDVGATTLDICGFVLHELDDQDQYELLTATVGRQGTAEVHRRRVSTLRCNGVPSIGLPDPLSPLPHWPGDYHRGCVCRPVDVDRDMRLEVAKAVMRHVMDLRRRRDPRSHRWRVGLPVFLCGGGSHIRLFASALDEADERMRSSLVTVGLRPRRLPMPDDLVNPDIDEQLFHRLSVAYGLSFNAWDIGGISPPRAIDDIPGPDTAPDIGDRFVSKDQV